MIIDRFRNWQTSATIWKRAAADGLIWGVGMSALGYLVVPRLRTILIGLVAGLFFGIWMFVALEVRASRS